MLQGQFDVGSNRLFIYQNGDSLGLPYYSNLSLNEVHDDTKLAIVVLHGASRNADDYYDRMYAIVNGVGMDSTIIIAPQFLRTGDLDDHNLSEDVLYWTSTTNWTAGYTSGNTSDHNRPFTISSYSIMDTLLYRLAMNNPILNQMVFVGFSAGGQFVNRYVGGNDVTERIFQEFNLSIRYIVGSPSSYLYMNDERRIQNTVDQFAVPSGCSGYNDYKYGLDGLNNYMSNAGSDSVRIRYSRREVIYLIGGSDDAGTTDCQSMAQGNHRYERSIIYFNYLQYYFSSEILGRHQHAIIPNIDHDSYNIFNSACGRKALFGYGDCDQLYFLNVMDFEVVDNYKLINNYPNPFNPVTTLRYDLPENVHVNITIYDMLGRQIKNLINQTQDVGYRSVRWNATDDYGKPVSAGIYLYQIQAGEFVQTKKMVLLK
jgi:hypothetical protein